MENTFFEDIPIDESLEIDAGAFTVFRIQLPSMMLPAYGAMIRPPVVPLYGIVMRPV